MNRFVRLLAIRLLFAGVFLDGVLMLQTMLGALTGAEPQRQTWVFDRSYRNARSVQGR